MERGCGRFTPADARSSLEGCLPLRNNFGWSFAPQQSRFFADGWAC